MAIISITVYASDNTEAENRNDANNELGQSSRVSAYAHMVMVMCIFLFCWLS